MNKAKTFLTLVVIWAITAMGSGVAQAVTLGEPGEALLVPGVNYDSAAGVNTMVGITVPSVLGGDPFWFPGGAPYDTALVTSAPAGLVANIPAPPAEAIHWFFFDEDSTHQLDNGMPATADDFVPFDWGATVVASGAALDGVPGYLVFANTAARAGGLPAPVAPLAGGFAMYGDAVIIQGNWASAAYIPVVPMTDTLDATAAPVFVDNVIWLAGIPTAVSPLAAGIQLDDDDGVADNCVIDMRYFLGPALGGGTDLVLWMDRNYGPPAFVPGYSNVAVDVFDTEEDSGSANINLSKELNWIDASTLPWTTHVDADGLTDEGFVYIELPELMDDGAVIAGPGGSCVAFSLIYFSGGATAAQVQTALAHERGVF
jgi:hypothetical protein